MMSFGAAGLLSLPLLLVLILLGVPIAVCLFGISIVGIALVLGPSQALALTGEVITELAANWNLSAIPMFVLMGNLAFRSGLTELLFAAARAWLGRLPGGLAVATNFACAGFGATSGSSIATTLAMGRLAIPEMRRSGYDPGLAAAVCASAGTIAVLVPPSILLVIYGIYAEQSISALFAAGILPGIMTALAYAVLIVARCAANPTLAPPLAERFSWGTRFRLLAKVWPLPILIIGVLGSIYSGLANPTEAGAWGACLAALIAGLRKGRAFPRVLMDSLTETVSLTANIFFIAAGAILYTKLVAVTGLSATLAAVFAPWQDQPALLITGIAVIFPILGMLLEPLGLILIALPVVLPLVKATGADMIWFGIVIAKCVELGLLIPPLGMNLFAVKSITGSTIPMRVIASGLIWFLVVDIAVLAVLIIYPQTILVLPRLLVGG
ncbi:MAG: TRAP transporter large permease [Rhodospirillaceae bacterium]|nr:TRAP transporter large permease [Rhodospirillaceae bacterium]